MGIFESGMESMIDVYIYETEGLLEQLDQILIKTESSGFSEEDINEIFRIMHTIKGSSAMMGLENMSALAHSIEDMFFIIREEKPKIESKQTLYDLVFAASDLLKSEVELLQDDDYKPTSFTAQIDKIEEYVGVLKQGGQEKINKTEQEPEKAVNSDKKSKGDASEISVRVFFDDGCGMENLRALLLINNIKEDCDEIYYEPDDIEKNMDTAKEIIENGFKIHFKAHDNSESILKLIENTLNVKSYEVIDLSADNKKNDNVTSGNKSSEQIQEDKTKPNEQIRTEEKEHKTDELLGTNNNTASHSQSKGKQSLISVNLNKLDKLLDMVGEIVITEAMVTSNPDLKGLKLDNFQKASRQLRKLTDELQDIVMSIRMVPLSGAFNKITRVVRDMKVKLNKEVSLVFEGEETEVDKSIIDNLNDPLMHMVRNSMDHGIEDPQERIEKGKPEIGTITLSAYNASGEVIIMVSDDGEGIDTEKVLEKARDSGLLLKPESEYSDKEIFNMIMLPGFSTNDEVTEYSGRGVGMDVVKKNIEKIGGSVSVDSRKGEGTSFMIKIPLSLAIVDGIEVSVGTSIFTIPINSIKESMKLKENQLIRDTSGQEMVIIRGQCFPLIRLHEIYNITPVSYDAYDGMVILVEAEGRSACILADELLGEQQVVVKPFSPLLSRYNVKQNGMAGLTILGDGSITIILDVNNIIMDY